MQIETSDMWNPHFCYLNTPLRRLKKDIACFFFFFVSASLFHLFFPLRVKLGSTEVPVQKRHAVL